MASPGQPWCLAAVFHVPAALEADAEVGLPYGISSFGQCLSMLRVLQRPLTCMGFPPFCLVFGFFCFLFDSSYHLELFFFVVVSTRDSIGEFNVFPDSKASVSFRILPRAVHLFFFFPAPY